MTYRLPDKQPGETIKGLYIDFVNLFLTGETISSATITASDPTVMQNMQISGTRVSWDATVGIAGEGVIFAVAATGNQGSIRDAEALMMIVSS